MACEHKRIKSVNCVIMCADCGEELPIDYLVGKDRIAKQAEPAATEEPAKAPAKKTGRKKVEK